MLISVGQKIQKYHSILCEKVLEWTNNFLLGPGYETKTARETFQVSVQQTRLCIWPYLLSSISLSMMTTKGHRLVHRRSVLTCWHCTSLSPISPQSGMWPQKQILLWFFLCFFCFPRSTMIIPSGIPRWQVGCSKATWGKSWQGDKM